MKNIFFTTLFLFIANNLLFADKIKALMPMNFLPYFTIDENDKPSGFAVEVLNHVAKDANYSIEYIIKPNYVDVEKGYLAKEGDLIVASGISDIRKKTSIFTTAISTQLIRAYKRSDFDISSLDEIKDHRLILKTGNIAVKYFKEHDRDRLRFVNSKEEGLLSLYTNQGDVFIINDAPIEKLITQLGFEKDIVSFGKSVHEVNFAIRIQKDQEDMQKRLNDSLIKFKKSKKYHYLYEKWILGKDLKDLKEYIDLTNEEQDWLKENPVITVGHSSSFEPLFIKEQNEKFKGIIPDIYGLIEDKLDVKFKYIEDEWSNIQNLAP